MKISGKKLFRLSIFAIAALAATLSLFGFLVLMPYAIANAHSIAVIVTCSVINLLNSLALVALGSLVDDN